MPRIGSDPPVTVGANGVPSQIIEPDRLGLLHEDLRKGGEPGVTVVTAVGGRGEQAGLWASARCGLPAQPSDRDVRGDQPLEQGRGGWAGSPSETMIMWFCPASPGQQVRQPDRGREILHVAELR